MLGQQRCVETNTQIWSQLRWCKGAIFIVSELADSNWCACSLSSGVFISSFCLLSNIQMQGNGPGPLAFSSEFQARPCSCHFHAAWVASPLRIPPTLMLMRAHYGNKYLIIEGNLIPAAAAAPLLERSHPPSKDRLHVSVAGSQHTCLLNLVSFPLFTSIIEPL